MTDAGTDSPGDDSDAGVDTGTRATVWLAPDQITRIKNACLTDTFASYLQHRNAAIVTVLADTGLRVGELVQLDTDYLRNDNTHLYIPGHIQKDYPTSSSPAPVTITLSEETRDTVTTYLHDRWKHTPALFPSRKSDRLTENGVRYVIRDAASAADVNPFLIDGSRGNPSDVTPHAFRHSVAYRMLHVETGNTLYDVRNRLRHRSLQTTERVYDHFRTV